MGELSPTSDTVVAVEHGGDPPSGTDLTPAEVQRPVDAPELDPAVNPGLQMYDVFWERQELIAECMAAEGFDYVPYVNMAPDAIEQSGHLGFYRPPISEEGRGEMIRQRQEYGLGVSIPGPELPLGPSEVSADPNFGIRDELAPEERQAYMDALVGVEGNGGVVSPGCGQRALDEIPEPVYSEQIATLMGEIREEFEERFRADPRVLSAHEIARECMVRHGFDIPDGGVGMVGTDPTGYMMERFEERTGINPQVETWDSDDIEASVLEQLQEEERAMAVTAAECDFEIIDAQAEAAYEIEEELIEEYGDLIASLGFKVDE